MSTNSEERFVRARPAFDGQCHPSHPDAPTFYEFSPPPNTIDPSSSSINIGVLANSDPMIRTLFDLAGGPDSLPEVQVEVNDALEPVRVLIFNPLRDGFRHASTVPVLALKVPVVGVLGVPIARHQKQAALCRRASNIIDAWSVVLPQRIVSEEVGDYLEDVFRRAARGQCVRVYLRIGAAIFWTGINTIRYFHSQIARKSTRSPGR